MATYRHWSVSLWRDPDDVSHCHPVPWQNWMAAYLGYTLQMKTLFRGWPVMVHDTHMRRRVRKLTKILNRNVMQIRKKKKNVQTSQSEYSCRTRVILWQWTVAQTLNYSYQIAFKVPYRTIVVELFYFPLMWDGIVYDVSDLKWITFKYTQLYSPIW